MRRNAKWRVLSAFVAAGFAIVGQARAEVTLSTFDDFNLDGLFAWANAAIVSGPTNYQVTYTGYGSGYKSINPVLDATGETTIQLTVTISAEGAAAGAQVSGPIVALVDGDGTMANYAWYGLTQGTHVLKTVLSSGTGLSSGSVPGLDLSTLSFFHLEDDPGSFHGTYTIAFDDLRLIGAARPKITVESYDQGAQQFTLTWKSLAGRSYNVLYAPDLTTGFSPIATDIASTGLSTTTVVAIPDGAAGFLEVQLIDPNAP